MFKLLGPEGCNQRIAELQAKLARINPPQKEGVEFFNTLDGQMNGAIGKDGFAPFNPTATGVTVTPVNSQLRAMIDSAATKYGVPKELLDALVSAESSYNPMARSKAGAMGLTQLMPGTASALKVTNPYDPEQNLLGGARYLRGLIDRFGDIPQALAAYNAGPTRIKDSSRPWPAETTAYVNKVMSLYEAGRSG
jgi:soluble lytic murein transglycosylase-like protein